MNIEPAKVPREMEELLELMAGRTSAIRASRCVRPPIGCDKPFSQEGLSELTLKEYSISGLCPACQERFFEEHPEATRLK